jgi:cell division transport system ATP-binding protein
MQTNPIISLIDVSVYRDKILTLSEISMEVEPGEFIYLIGKTGSGKSSLLKTLYAELPIEEGTATIAGFKLNQIKASEVPFLRRKLGIVFQDFQLLTDRSINDNLEFVMRATGWKDEKKILNRKGELLATVGIPAKGYKMPHELSGGEQQRVCIARALVNKPGIILADEPTGNLDPETSEEIIKVIYEISKEGTAVILATHNYNLIEKFPGRVVRLDRGRVVE